MLGEYVMNYCVAHTFWVKGNKLLYTNFIDTRLNFRNSLNMAQTRKVTLTVTPAS